MNELVDEWVSKAEEDYYVAGLALSGGEVPVPSTVCFHAQQCAEKYLKAFLTSKQSEFPRTHNFTSLLDLCESFDNNFGALRSGLISLQSYAVAIRYPGFTADNEMATAALAIAKRVRAFIRPKLNLT